MIGLGPKSLILLSDVVSLRAGWKLWVIATFSSFLCLGNHEHNPEFLFLFLLGGRLASPVTRLMGGWL